jgi:hypothetical protein
MAGNWMQWLQGMNTGAPGGPMGPGPGGPGQPPMPQLGGPPPGSMGPGPGAGGPPPGGGMPPPGGGGMPPPGGGGMPPPNAPLQPVGQINPASMPQLAKPTGKLPGANLSDADRTQADIYTTLMQLQPEEAKFKRQRAMAEQLRAGGKLPGMRHEAVAAHPLEALNSALSGIGGAYMGSKADAAEDEYGSKRRAELEAMRIRQGL